jgi:hypothetical protein
MKVKLITQYSQSHAKMLDSFLGSFQDSDIELVINRVPQVCATGAFRSADWSLATRNKIIFLINEIKLFNCDILVFSDIDVQFFSSIKEYVIDSFNRTSNSSPPLDIIFQNDCPFSLGKQICTGFFALKPSDKVLKFWNCVLENMQDNKHLDDQDVTQLLLQSWVDVGLSVDVFNHRVFTYGHTLDLDTPPVGGLPWNPLKDVSVPEDIVVHHANWTVGIENKILLLDKVRENLKASVRQKPN